VEFYEADGIHYGALDMAGFTQLGVLGFLYGYGYNPVPDAPFNLSDIPSMPTPEPFTWALLTTGMALIFYRRKRKTIP